MKITFMDKLSVFNRPTVEHQFSTEEELSDLLSKYDCWQYASDAEITDDDGKRIMRLRTDDNGHWGVNYWGVQY